MGQGDLLIKGESSTGKDRSPKRYVAIQRWYETSSRIPHFISLFDREISDFYCWAIQKEGCILVGAALEEREERKRTQQEGTGQGQENQGTKNSPGDLQHMEARFDKVLNHLRGEGYDLGRCVRKEGSWIMRPRSLGEIRLAQGSVALVGEAAGWISPSSAEGISYALKSAEALGEALNRGLEGYRQRYKKNAKKLYLAMAGKIMKAPVYTSFLRGWIMKSGLLSMKVRSEKAGNPIEFIAAQ